MQTEMQAGEILGEDDNLRKTAALELVARGFSVFAVQKNKKSPDPLLAPHGHLGATKDTEIVAGWFDVKPKANIRIACGQAYGYVVLDVDVKNGARGMESYAALGLGDVATLTARTPTSGFHLFFNYPSGVTLRAKHPDYPGIDIKGGGEGGYVVASPSTLPHGAYTWLDPEMPIADMPFALVAALEDTGVATVARGRKTNGNSPTDALITNEGDRHEKLLKLAGVYRKQGLEAPEIEVLLWSHAERYFDPPFARDNSEEQREIEGLAHWVEKKAPGEPEPAEDAWHVPLPLIVDTASDAYPVDALPGVIGVAVREVEAFVQCPAALAACSALSVLSLSAQGLANVRRGLGLEGPIGLYFLPIAGSGDRKSECDRRFAAVVHAWEAEQVVLVEPEAANYRAALAAWEAEREAVLLQVKHARKKGESTEEARSELARLERERPTPVRIPRLLLESETQESLAWNLARPDGWPIGGLLSSEAGIVFGGHSMREDSRMRTLALFNKLWSGEPYRVSRRTSESFTVVGARLTVGLAVQPEAIQSFSDDSHGLARGSGFLARFLIAWPPSRQGTRFYRKAPLDWPALSAFERRLRELLDTPLNFNERGELEPPPIDLEPPAFDVWRGFHDTVERELRLGGEMTAVDDTASKAAENVARLAALFHLFEHGTEGHVSVAHVTAASRIVTWHLYEARRVLNGLTLSKGLSAAAKLNDWLTRICRERRIDRLPMREVMQFGPNSLRRKLDLQAALAELLETHRVRLEDNIIVVNPALLAE
jgi:Protein of unknown function (DUF3987)/Bifunctional DNA primase/polymerase, N-terminal